MKIHLFTIILILLSVQLFGQYDVWMMDGRVYKITDSVNISSSGLEVQKTNGKIILVDTSDVFALVGKQDSIFYYNGSEQEIRSATMFMKGQIDGLKYKNRMLDAGAFLVGFASPVLLVYTPISSFYSPLVSGIYVATASSIPPNTDKVIQDSVLRNNPDYIKGYKYSVARKKVKNATFYSVLGLAAGISTVILLEKY